MAKKGQKKKDHFLIKVLTTLGLLLIFLLALFEAGKIGLWLKYIIMIMFGNSIFGLLFTLIIILYCFITKKVINTRYIIGLVSLNLSLILFSHYFMQDYIIGLDEFNQYIKDIPLITGKFFAGEQVTFKAGIVGAITFALLSSLISNVGVIILSIILFVLALVLLVDSSIYKKIYTYIINRKNTVKTKIEKKDVVQKKRTDETNTNCDVYQYDELKNNAVKPKNKSIFITADKDTIKDNNNGINNSNNELKADNQEVKPIKVVSTKFDYKSYKLPTINLLEPKVTNTKSNINETSAKIKGQKIIEILSNFGIKSELIQAHIGPSVTKFEIKPDSTVKVSKILNIQDNIKMELAARDVRIEAPISGRNAVGIEIPNAESIPVKMIELMKNIPSKTKHNKLLLALGKDLMGQGIFCELDRMPHLLIAGQTGSGKSVCMNTIVTSLLIRTTPEDVKLLLIDPKKVEFTPYHNVPHLLGPVISDANDASNALKVIVNMMEERYDLFAKCHVRNIKGYNELDSKEKDINIKKLPYIVVIIDELADLMAICGKDVETSIQRITQLARASGIHLIVATQRPSTDVITGIIKSNIPSRISFAVASGIDSRTILDSIGAERLLGNGDMLYYPTGEPSPLRLQGVFLSDNEVNKITDFVKSQGLPMYDDAFIRLQELSETPTLGTISLSDDPLFEEVKEFVVDKQKASTSLIQRRFGIGYNRAARIIDLLEERRVIGPPNGSKPREVYIKENE